MPKNSVTDWDTTAGNNTDIGGINIAEGCAPSGINNAIRTVMSQIKTWTATLLTTTAAVFTPTDQATMRANISAPLKGHIHGLTLSNNGADATNDIDIAAGEAASTETNPVLMVLASALTKRLDAAWAVGTGNGGLDTGSIANGTYHVWLIRRSDTGVVDVLLSASATSPTMPTNYDQKRRIGSIIRASAAILEFIQVDDHFQYVTPVTDRSSTSALSETLVALTVPTGIVVFPIFTQSQEQNAAGNALTGFGSAGTDAVSAVATKAGAERSVGTFSEYFTDTSAQIAMVVSIVSGSLTNNLTITRGWIDRRGK